MNIPEGTSPGLQYPLPVAEDRDTIRNSIVDYSLLSHTDHFSLNVKRNLDNTFKVSLVLHDVLDRESRDSYYVQVIWF